MRHFASIIICLIIAAPSSAQDSLQQKILIQLGYGVQLGGGDFAKRYGSHGILEGSLILHLKTMETGPSFQFLYGSKVKEDVLALLRTPEGDLIGLDHMLAEVDLRLRGLVMGWKIAKSFPVGNAGGEIAVGIQPSWISHWIRFQNTGNSFEPIQGIYRYGYDRLSTGWGLQENVSYRYLSKNHLINFEIEAHLIQANTTIRRNTQFDNPATGLKKQKDGLMGIVAKWIIPIYTRKNPENIYY